MNQPPTWAVGTPASLDFTSAGGTYNFAPHVVDPQPWDVFRFYLIGTPPIGYSINQSSGILTVLNGSPNGTVQIRVVDSEFAYADHFCNVTVAASTGSGTVIHNTSFDTDPATVATAPSGYVLSRTGGTGEEYSFVTSGQRSGARSYRMSLTRNSASDWRCELAGTSQGNDPFTNANGTCNPIEYWLGYSQRLVAPWPTDTMAEVILQWHGGNTVQGTFEQSPGWDLSPVLCQLSYSNGAVRIFNRWCDLTPGSPGAPVVGSDCYGAGYESRMVAGTLAEYEGIWTDWVWHVVWDWRQTGTPVESTTQVNSNWKNTSNNGGTGRVEIWNKKAGQTAYTKRVDYRGPTGTNAYYANPLLQGSIYYLKYGIYKRGWEDAASVVSSRSIDFDNVKAIKFGGSFEQVEPPASATYIIPIANTTAIRTLDGALNAGMAGATWTTTAGVVRRPQAGDIIELAAGTHAQRSFEFKNLNGTQASPIIVRGPQSGTQQAVIRRVNNEDGFWVSEVDRCNWLTIDGYSAGIGSPTTAPYNCGIKITYSLAAVSGNPGSITGKDGPSCYMKHIGPMQGVTIKHIHIDGGWILTDSVVTDPNGYGQGYSFEGGGVFGHDAGVAAAAGVWNQQDFKYLYNYVQRTQGEGLYIGSNYYDHAAPHRNIEIAYNRIEDCGAGGIHQKCFFEGDNRCHHNIIKRCGQVTPTASRIGITGGTGTSKIYNNWIEDMAGDSTRPNGYGGRPDGIQAYMLESGAPLIGELAQGFYGPYTSFPLEIYNNVIFNGGNAALYATGSANYSHGIYVGWPNAAYVPHVPKVYNNTVVGNYGRGIWIETAGVGSFVKNNVVIENVITQIQATGNAPASSNTTTGSAASVFVNSSSNNFHLASPTSHVALGTLGVDIAAVDYEDAARPQGAASDRGAYED